MVRLVTDEYKQLFYWGWINLPLMHIRIYCNKRIRIEMSLTWNWNRFLRSEYLGGSELAPRSLEGTLNCIGLTGRIKAPTFDLLTCSRSVDQATKLTATIRTVSLNLKLEPLRSLILTERELLLNLYVIPRLTEIEMNRRFVDHSVLNFVCPTKGLTWFVSAHELSCVGHVCTKSNKLAIQSEQLRLPNGF